MAKNSIRDYSATSSLNTDVQSVDISEGCAASGINNAIREVMADLKDVSSGTIALESPQADSLTVTGDLTVDTNTLYVDSTNNRTGLGNASPETTVHIEGDVSGLNDGNVMHIESNGDGGNRGINIGQEGDGSQARMFLQGYHSQNTSNYWDLLLNPYGGSVGIGTTSPTTYGDSNTKLAVVTPTSNANDVNIRFGTNDVKGIIFVNDVSGDGVGFGTTTNDHLQFNTNNTERMRIEPTYGRLLINRTSASTVAPYSKLHVLGDAAVDVVTLQVGTNGYSALAFLNASGSLVGSVTANASSTSYNTSSDHRLKQGVEDMTGAIDRVKALAPKRFNFIADADTTVDGFLAHEAQAVVPEAVTGTKDAMRDEEYEVTPAVLDDDGNVVTEAVMGTRSVPDYQGIDQSKLVPLLTGALQEAIAKIEALEARIEALEIA